MPYWPLTSNKTERKTSNEADQLMWTHERRGVLRNERKTRKEKLRETMPRGGTVRKIKKKGQPGAQFGRTEHNKEKANFATSRSETTGVIMLFRSRC